MEKVLDQFEKVKNYYIYGEKVDEPVLVMDIHTRNIKLGLVNDSNIDETINFYFAKMSNLCKRIPSYVDNGTDVNLIEENLVKFFSIMKELQEKKLYEWDDKIFSEFISGITDILTSLYQENKLKNPKILIDLLLDIDPTNAWGYLLSLIIELKLSHSVQLNNFDEDLRNYSQYNNLLKYVNTLSVSYVRAYNSKYYNLGDEYNEKYLEENFNIAKQLLKEKKYEASKDKFQSVIGYKTSRNSIKRIEEKLADIYIKEHYQEPKIIEFGYYPQTIKSEDVSIVSTKPDEDGYYLGSDGERYAFKVINRGRAFLHFSDYTAVDFGEYKGFYFKVEPIQWVIKRQLGRSYRLMSVKVLDFCTYSIKRSIYDIPDKYMQSNVKKWLNHIFFNKAFSKEMQNYVIPTYIQGETFIRGQIIRTDEHDYLKAYLPSYKDTHNKLNGYGKLEEELIKGKTDYAIASGCRMVYCRTSAKGMEKTRCFWYRCDGYFQPCDTLAKSNTFGVAPCISLSIDYFDKDEK